MSEILLPMFSPRIFTVSSLTLESLIHFECILVYGVRGQKLKQIKQGEKILIGTDNSMVRTRGKGGVGEVEEDKGGIDGEGRRPDLGW